MQMCVLLETMLECDALQLCVSCNTAVPHTQYDTHTQWHATTADDFLSWARRLCVCVCVYRYVYVLISHIGNVSALAIKHQINTTFLDISFDTRSLAMCHDALVQPDSATTVIRWVKHLAFSWRFRGTFPHHATQRVWDRKHLLRCLMKDRCHIWI